LLNPNKEKSQIEGLLNKKTLAVQMPEKKLLLPIPTLSMRRPRLMWNNAIFLLQSSVHLM
jgi:hypothetical protein